MKKMFTLCGLICFSLVIKAQIITQITSPSAIGSMIPGYSQVSTYNTKTIAYTPSTPDPTPNPVDQDTTTEDIKKYDYANPLSVSIAMADGNITSTSFGKVWTLRISVPNALNIGITFNQFNLSATAEMYIFNEARTVVKGKILKSYFTNTTAVTTSPMSTNSIIVYIVEPNNFGTLQSIISIQSIMAGYQPIDDVGSTSGGSNFKADGGVIADGASLNCDPLIMCSPGKMSTARAVARFFTGNGFTCTGTLINNEANNGRALFLTAFHCLDINPGVFGGHPGNNNLDANEIAALQRSVVQFQAWRTTCNGTIDNFFIEFYGTMLRASSVTSDVVLLELLDQPGIGDGVNYAGWNRDGAEPSDNSSFIIHHPLGEDMRLTTTRDISTFFWNHDFWTAHYSSGTVTKGSSGSALFNQLNQITGQLRSGWSNCNFTDYGDRYGKFSSSWTYANLRPWLSLNQNLASMYSLDLYPLTIKGPSSIYCGGSGGNAQFSVPGGLLGCSYYWTIGGNLQYVSGQGTGTLTVRGTQTSNTNSYVQVTISDSKGRNRTATATQNLTLLIGAPTVNAQSTNNNYCSGTYQTWKLTASPAIGSNWSWSLDHYIKTGSDLYIDNSSASSTLIDISGSAIVKLSYTDACGVAASTTTYVYSTCAGKRIYNIAPNPANNLITISTINGSIKTKALQDLMYAIKITDRFGILRKSSTYKSGVSSTTISVADLNAGTYLVAIFDGKEWSSEKLIIQK